MDMNSGTIFYKKKEEQDQNFISSSQLFNIQKNTYENKPSENIGNIVQISNFFNVTNEIQQKQEYKEDQHTTQLSFFYNNMPHQSFLPSRKTNELDDLQELLKSRKVSEILMSSRLNNFIDPNFKPDKKAILGYKNKNQMDIKLSQLIFLTPSKFFKQPILVSENIDSNDIYQGSLGDCYLLAAISSIANSPHRLERLFLIKNYNKNGVYIIALCINGIWQEVILDDYFVCDKLTMKPAFNYNKNNELWVMLLEKAWAKVHGGYMNISSGITREALRDLTGAPAITFFSDSVNQNEFWEKLLDSYEKNFIMTAGSDDLSYGRGDIFISKIGLAGSHAYSLLGVYEIVKINGIFQRLYNHQRNGGNFKNIERIVKLRNPWGKGEWKGDWSDRDKRWTKNLKQQFGMKVKDDGIFFMDYKNYLKFFSDTQFCYYHDSYKYSAISLLSQPIEETFLSFEIKKQGKYYLSLNQKNRRFFRPEKKYSYSFLSMIIIKENNGNYEYINYSIKKDKENWVDCNLKKGLYFVLISTPWISCVNEFSFSIYGPAISKIKKLIKNSRPRNLIEIAFKNHARKNNKKSFKLNNSKNCNILKWNNKKGLGYIYFKNISKNKEIDITVEMEGSNVEFYRYSSEKPNFKLKPNSDKVIIFIPTRLPTRSRMRVISSESDYKKKNSRKQIEEKAKKIFRKFNGQNVGIYFYALKTDDFLVYQYVNESYEFFLEEHISFNLDNCYITGIYGNSIDFILEPRDERMILIQKIQKNKPFKVKISKSYHKVN